MKEKRRRKRERQTETGRNVFQRQLCHWSAAGPLLDREVLLAGPAYNVDTCRVPIALPHPVPLPNTADLVPYEQALFEQASPSSQSQLFSAQLPPVSVSLSTHSHTYDPQHPSWPCNPSQPSGFVFHPQMSTTRAPVAGLPHSSENPQNT